MEFIGVQVSWEVHYEIFQFRSDHDPFMLQGQGSRSLMSLSNPSALDPAMPCKYPGDGIYLESRQECYIVVTWGGMRSDLQGFVCRFAYLPFITSLHFNMHCLDNVYKVKRKVSKPVVG